MKILSRLFKRDTRLVDYLASVDKLSSKQEMWMLNHSLMSTMEGDFNAQVNMLHEVRKHIPKMSHPLYHGVHGHREVFDHLEYIVYNYYHA